jgi:hypothetical protein
MVTRRPYLLRSLLGTLSTLLSMPLPFGDALADVDGGTWHLLLSQHGLCGVPLLSQHLCGVPTSR